MNIPPPWICLHLYLSGYFRIFSIAFNNFNKKGSMCECSQKYPKRINWATRICVTQRRKKIASQRLCSSWSYWRSRWVLGSCQGALPNRGCQARFFSPMRRHQNSTQEFSQRSNCSFLYFLFCASIYKFTHCHFPLSALSMPLNLFCTFRIRFSLFLEPQNRCFDVFAIERNLAVKN